MPHIEQQIRNTELASDNTLHVIGVTSNPVRYHSRYRLTREWIEQMRATAHVELYVVETAFGDRQHEIADVADDRQLQLRTNSEIWIKESMINLGVRHLLPHNWKYVAWVDTDILFRDAHWAQETLHQLQHFPIIQPWQQCADLGFNGNIMQTHQSLGWLQQGASAAARKAATTPALEFDDPYRAGHTGYAWACTRRFWEQTNGLLDHCILGSADNHMGRACIGETHKTIHGKMHPNFHKRALEWQERALVLTHGQLGYARGRIEHAFHGPKAKRYYNTRWQILIDHQFDPATDIMHDEQGLVQLVGKPALEQAVRQYNRSRSEDSIEE